MKQLIELIPVNVRPQMAVICEKLFRVAQKCAAVGAQLDEINQHVNNSTLPPFISARTPNIQVSKEFVDNTLVEPRVKVLETEAIAYGTQILNHHVAVKTAELAHLVGLTSEAK